ncbi:MAG: DivIVA domain-containing protein [Erysipelotrichaceae bacterium]|nr:DivIVA domain-containing protein [Erysipelotrichaceae bacterium]MBQ6127026.1 DivIVA domain-containing protein [Erysipelotrichaceae bacterium]MBR2533361.1 DivIVA domain-containing protein [Erysipelotrichaceae bacterium]
MEKLNLTPEEILNKEFNVDFKGYSPSEVDTFLDTVLEDYQIMEENVQQLLDTINDLQAQVKELTSKNIDLEGRKVAFDLSNTTSYSSVDILKRISRLEEQILNK